MFFKKTADDSDPYTTLTPRSPRPRRASNQFSTAGSSSSSFLQPPTQFQSRNRSTSLPSIDPTGRGPRAYGGGRGGPSSRIPQPSGQACQRTVSPSRLPRPQSRQYPTVLQPQNRTPHNSSPPVSIPTSISTSYCEQLKTKPRNLVKPSPTLVMNYLHDVLGRDIVNVTWHLEMDDLLALHERELMERRNGRGSRQSSLDMSMNIFGVPLRQVSMYASTAAILGGLEHELPIVVYSCVEELYRGIKSQPIVAGSSSARVAHLVETFDSPPHFGCTTSLFKESEGDVYALLTTFLSRLPEPVIYPEGIMHTLRQFCTGTHHTQFQDLRLRTVQLLLRLLPSANLSLFIYLLAFLSQVVQEQPGVDENIANAFGDWIFGTEAGTPMMIWFLKNWGAVVKGLFELPFDIGMPLAGQERRSYPRLQVESPVPVRLGDMSALNVPADTPESSPSDTSPFRPGEQASAGIDEHISPRRLTESPVGDSALDDDDASEHGSLCPSTVSALEERLLDVTLPASPVVARSSSPPLLRVINSGSSNSTSTSGSTSPITDFDHTFQAILNYAPRSDHLLELEKKLKISDAAKVVPKNMTSKNETGSVASRAAKILVVDGCQPNCVLRERVRTLEESLVITLRERDEARELVEDIRRVMMVNHADS
ncbi:uncharacterized protein EV420DRAFT_1492550 [Desarmillaria tabescens]|uniref:Rho-GAP domain-containing protein n=1 Tax=Armillaria tabescens TaxID=1929756 RepID=A0AA39U838_ARMTA|nr:uncharacterized protein EV420DRAFT_1492550 [Desarmillaria tabescens]KAK0469110.1 hypothetical protein EV420DRAFT_1492550 [Desarmillaria tabescens]